MNPPCAVGAGGRRARLRQDTQPRAPGGSHGRHEGALRTSMTEPRRRPGIWAGSLRELAAASGTRSDEDESHGPGRGARLLLPVRAVSHAAVPDRPAGHAALARTDGSAARRTWTKPCQPTPPRSCGAPWRRSTGGAPAVGCCPSAPAALWASSSGMASIMTHSTGPTTSRTPGRGGSAACSRSCSPSASPASSSAALVLLVFGPPARRDVAAAGWAGHDVQLVWA